MGNTDNVVGDGHEEASKEEASKEEDSEEEDSEEDSEEEDSSEEDSSKEESSEEDSSEEESSEEDNSEEDGNEEDSSESQEDVPVVVHTKVKPVWKPRARPNPRPKKQKPVDALLTKIKNLEKAKLAKIDKFLGPFFKKIQTVL